MTNHLVRLNDWSKTMPHKSPTLSDVAREAGVSPYTVSGVLNGARTNTRVSAATRARIMESAARLRYQPNAQARNLARNCTKTVGILFDYLRSSDVLTSSYSSAILQGIVSRASLCGYDILLYTDNNGGESERFRDRRTDGIIIVAPRTGDHIVRDLAASHLPLVAISADPEQAREFDFLSIDVDNEQGIFLAVSHLAERGHRRIAHLTGDLDMVSVGIRRHAFCQAVAERGLPDGLIFTCGYNGSLVEEALNALLALPDPPTAIVAGNDTIALQVLAGAAKRNIAVPDALSVIGFDDAPAASHVTPKLTTLRQPLTAIGAEAVRLLIERIESGPVELGGDKSAPAQNPCLLPPTLVARESTAAAPIFPLPTGEERPPLKGH